MPVNIERSHLDGVPLPRRSLFRAGAAVAGGAVAGSVLGTAPGYAAAGSRARGKAVRPPALKAGDRVRIVAPAYPGDPRLDRGTEILESFGLVVEFGDHVYDTLGYLAGTDADRLADLNAAFRDPGVRCVFAHRAGLGRVDAGGVDDDGADRSHS
jgi:muramoyltetrapeptide carboxypeptidase